MNQVMSNFHQLSLGARGDAPPQMNRPMMAPPPPPSQPPHQMMTPALHHQQYYQQKQQYQNQHLKNAPPGGSAGMNCSNQMMANLAALAQLTQSPLPSGGFPSWVDNMGMLPPPTSAPMNTHSGLKPVGLGSNPNMSNSLAMLDRPATMQIRCKFGSLGELERQFHSPHGFCMGPNEEIIVADTYNHRIQVIQFPFPVFSLTTKIVRIHRRRVCYFESNV